MVDPWRHLNDWNKPSNKADSELEGFFQEAKTKTDFAAAKRVILRGKTTEVIDQITDGRVGFCLHRRRSHLEGHRHRSDSRLPQNCATAAFWVTTTLQGRNGNTTLDPSRGWYSRLPGCFAEAVGATIYALPHSQFCLQKTQFAFIDITGHYDDVGLQTQFAPEKFLKLAAGERFPRLLQVARKIRGLLPG